MFSSLSHRITGGTIDTLRLLGVEEDLQLADDAVSVSDLIDAETLARLMHGADVASVATKSARRSPNTSIMVRSALSQHVQLVIVRMLTDPTSLIITDDWSFRLHFGTSTRSISRP